MTIASFSFFLRTPEGKIPVPSQVLRHPLLLDAGEEHPTLTMADYFESLRQLVLAHQNTLSPPILPGEPAAPVHCIIVSEKLGTFYHVAKVLLQAGDSKFCLAVNTALSAAGKECLHKDQLLLGRHLPAAMSGFVPKFFLYCGIENISGTPTPFHHMVVEWLEDFHEWHLCSSGQAEPRIGLWTDNHLSYLKENEARDLFRQIARIITLSYDWDHNSFLRQWHHAAGDFIARRQGTGLDVRLITVRALGPFTFLNENVPQVKLSSLLLFLVDLSLRMRLDKLDGVGETVWLDDFVVEETVRGFFSGMVQHRDKMGDAYETLLQILPHFSADDFRQLSAPLLCSYQQQLSSADFAALQSSFTRHLELLTACLAGQPRESQAAAESAKQPA